MKTVTKNYQTCRSCDRLLIHGTAPLFAPWLPRSSHLLVTWQNHRRNQESVTRNSKNSKTNMTQWEKRSSICRVSHLTYSGSKNCPNVCPFLRDQYGMKCWHKQGTWYDYINYYDILALKWTLGDVIWIKTHWVIGQTKWLLIGAVFWPSIILLSSILYDHLLLW